MLKYWISQNKELVFMSIVAFMFFYIIVSDKKSEIIVIAVDKFGTRILGDKKADQELRDLEITQFIDEFISYYFNFDEKNFKDQISNASGYLSSDLWLNQELEQFKLLENEMKKSEFKELSQITKIEFLENQEKYKIVLKTELTSKQITKSKEVTLILSLKSKERSKDNPWGLEIDALQRIY